ncbi:hypothetical protein ACFVP0_31520 [Streptomyces cinereoruber]|uniref:hypothetical protein n=1 Tax=Streptomyces cinereoruber TaxID=67260 RepID=UPI00368B7AFB
MDIKSDTQAQYEIQRATALLVSLLDAAGDGCHVLVAAASVNEGLVANAPFHNRGEMVDLDPNDALEVMTLLILAASVGGGVVLRTNLTDGTSRVRGWRLVGFCAEPLDAAEIFTAYCTDAVTGEAIAPEPDVQYVAAPRLKV